MSLRGSGVSAGLLLTAFAMLFNLGCALERRFIFLPEKSLNATPADAGLPFETVFLTTSDGVRIHGWFVPAAGSRQALLWLHGNAGNIGNRIPLLTLLHQRLKRHILIIDYRGYGKSGGTVSEKGTIRDAAAAFDYLSARPDVGPDRIVLFGRSLGAAVAVSLAAERQPAGMILEAPFTSIREMARTLFPWLPVGRFLSTRYDSIDTIRRIRTPLLILHGDRDEVVPYRQGRALFEAANPPKRFYTLRGAGHNNSYRVGGEGYFEAIKTFLDALTPT